MGLSMKDRQSVTKALCAQYRKASKKTKGIILDQFVEATGYDRCYARWLLRNHGRRVQVAPGAFVEGHAGVRRPCPRPKTYGPEMLPLLIKVWRMLDYLSGKRLAAALPEVVVRLERLGEIRVSRAVRAKLLRISPATIDRLLKPERAKHQLKGHCHTKPGTLLKHQIPVRTFADWDQTRPGFLEMDLVGHDGGSTAGDYCFTLDVTDVTTGWSEQMATVNKAQTHVFCAINALRESLPFAVLGLDSDNGSEFINNQMLRWCKAENITFTRSRPYRKNDTCYVEQKNWSIVRRFVGYGRLEGEQSCEMLNKLYALLRDYNNFFMPSMKLVEKTRCGARVTRKHDKPKTPYQRLVESPEVPGELKTLLMSHYDTLNLAQLHRDIRAMQAKIQKQVLRPPKGNGTNK
jgi:hypothetical protein